MNKEKINEEIIYEKIEKPLLDKENEYNIFVEWLKRKYPLYYKTRDNILKIFNHPRIDLNTLDSGVIWMNIFAQTVDYCVLEKIAELFGDDYYIDKNCQNYLKIVWDI